MLSRHFVDKLTKIRHLVYVKSVQHFGIGNKLMERVPRDIKNCERLKPAHTPISSEDIEPKAATDNSFFWGNFEAPPVQTFNLFRIKEWWEYNEKLVYESNQGYDAELVQKVGSNLAAAFFVLQWSGKVKFKNSDWIENKENKQARLPSSYHPQYIVTAIDASNTHITYNGLENMTNLSWLTWLSFKGCKFIDDWCIDKISAHYPELEYLDISDCENVTERGLEALYRMLKLKTLIVTNHHKSAAFELTCLMLEDCNPDLKCQILNLRYSNEHEESHEKNDTNYK